ncbi:hypothetical protein CANCADRAFT_31471 [Tortispora caseinolytica NRRL Y-17796]|uniref:Uncharacterized protein n=1 Tax=Tortispora caseinolytica NRRL Y-17796 TaxID=767744 RepID=A0A1E4TFS6_9ASCO|nr:hypothetical protein CANCADRAFT_31471 [Tortispora caseinolytica NRRL Y-17796]
MSSILRSSLPLRFAAFSRAFSSTGTKLNVAELRVVGRLGSDIEEMTSKNGKPYIRYAVAVSSLGPPPTEEGAERETFTQWFNIVDFTPSRVPFLTAGKFTKGSLVLAEADIRPSADGSPMYRHRRIQLLAPSSKRHSVEDSEFVAGQA